MKKLAIPVMGSASFGILMGNGLSIKGGGICKGVVVSLQNIMVVEDFLPMVLGCTYVILGMK